MCSSTRNWSLDMSWSQRDKLSGSRAAEFPSTMQAGNMATVADGGFSMKRTFSFVFFICLYSMLTLSVWDHKVCAVFNWETLLVQMRFPRTSFLIVRTHSWLRAMYCIINALLFHMLWPWMYELTLFCGRQGLEESMKVFHRAGPRTVPWGAPVRQAFPGIFVPKAY